MKEAAGEANMTVITIILIGVVLAVANPMVKRLMGLSEKRSCCQANGGTWESGTCNGASDSCPETKENKKDNL